MSKFVLDQVGSDFFLGVYGTKDEVELEYNKAFNYSITNGEPFWLHENSLISGHKVSFAYFSTTMEAMIEGYSNAFAAQMSREMGQFDIPKEISLAARELAVKFVNNVKREHFVAHLRASKSL